VEPALQRSIRVLSRIGDDALRPTCARRILGQSLERPNSALAEHVRQYRDDLQLARYDTWQACAVAFEGDTYADSTAEARGPSATTTESQLRMSSQRTRTDRGVRRNDLLQSRFQFGLVRQTSSTSIALT